MNQESSVCRVTGWLVARPQRTYGVSRPKIGAILAAGTVIAAVAGNPDLSVTLAISLVAFVAGYILGGG